MPASWVFTWETIWPMVQVIIEPFGNYIAIIMAISAGFIVLSRVMKMGR